MENSIFVCFTDGCKENNKRVIEKMSDFSLHVGHLVPNLS